MYIYIYTQEPLPSVSTFLWGFEMWLAAATCRTQAAAAAAAAGGWSGNMAYKA